MTVSKLWMTCMATVVALGCAAAANAAFIDILSNHGGVSDPAPYTIINTTNGGGTADLAESTHREAHNLLDGELLSGDPLEHGSAVTEPGNAYWNSANGSPRGNVGLVIDLGGVYELDAMHLFGYNVADTAGGFDYPRRTPGDFSVKTATDPDAVTIQGAVLLVDDPFLFTQHGSTFGVGYPGANPTFGRTFLFGGADQPNELGGGSYEVTSATVIARYVFLGGMTPIWMDDDRVGLGEILFYGTEIPEPSTLLLSAAGLAGLGLRGRRRRRAA